MRAVEAGLLQSQNSSVKAEESRVSKHYHVINSLCSTALYKLLIGAFVNRFLLQTRIICING